MSPLGRLFGDGQAELESEWNVKKATAVVTRYGC
jgi:hypothetical protein